MDSKIMLESFFNAIDIGAVFESINNYRMAAAIMAEEGFTQVYNIKGGMRRRNRWMKLSRKVLFTKIASCCTQTS